MIDGFDIEAIPVRWLIAIFGEETGRVYLDAPELISEEAQAALLALQAATFTQLPGLQ